MDKDYELCEMYGHEACADQKDLAERVKELEEKLNSGCILTCPREQPTWKGPLPGLEDT